MTFASIRHWIIFKRGRNLLLKGRWQEAASALRNAVRLDRDHWESHNNLAIAFLKLGRWEEAAAACQRAISLEPGLSESHLNFGVALLKLARWDEAAAVYHRAIKLNPGSKPLYEKLGLALSRLERWEEAAASFREAIDLDRDNPDPALYRDLGAALVKCECWEEAASAFRRVLSLDPTDSESYASLATAIAKLESSKESVAAQQRAVALAPDNAAAHLSLGIELAKLERWEEAASALGKGSSLAADAASFDFLLVDPLMRLGRAHEAVAAHRRAVELGGAVPSLPGEAATTRFERRRASFWTPENFGVEVFRVERWLEHLASVPAPSPSPTKPETTHTTVPARTARLLFILDNDYGELTTLMYLALGQQLLNQTTLLLPERLHVNNPEALPGHTHRYASLEDVVRVADAEKPDVVFLCSGYLFSIHRIFSLESLEHLVRLLRDRGCRVVTSDPFLGMLSKQDPRTLISLDIPQEHSVLSVELLRKAQEAEERLRTHFSRCEKILKDAYHLYPTYCDVPQHLATSTDSRNISFFNSKLIFSEPVWSERGPSQADDASKPHWLFILSERDYDTQRLFEDESRFIDIVAGKLVETLAAGRHPILVGPNECIETLAPRMPTTEGIDILSYCSFNWFLSLLLSAEYAFYWNVVSHSILIRLFNNLPIILFDRGHVVRNVTAMYDRVVQWYYQGWEPKFFDHRQPLTLETVSAWTEAYRQDADRICERFRRAPTPGQMIAKLVNGEAPRST